MLNTTKVNLVLEFVTGTDEKGEPILSKVTISNLRMDLTTAQLWEVVTVFRNLIKYKLSEAYVVSTQVISPN